MASGVNAWHGMIGSSGIMQTLYDDVRKVAATDLRVHLVGESGVGKELVARAIHSESKRKSEPYVACNVAGLVDSILESELFGNEQGAFTDAKRQRQGYIEQAKKGTLFLDEIAKISEHMQISLLRALEYPFRRVGGKDEIRTECRIVTAGSSSLEDQVRAGMLSPEFYYRIRGVVIYIPALRERGAEDIILLANHVLRESNPKASLTPEAESLLTRHTWPGNVRELIPVIQAVSLTAPGSEITAADLEGHLATLTRCEQTQEKQPDRKMEAIYELLGNYARGRPLSPLQQAVFGLRPPAEALEEYVSIRGKVAEIESLRQGLEEKYGMPFGLIASQVRHEFKHEPVSPVINPGAIVHEPETIITDEPKPRRFHPTYIKDLLRPGVKTYITLMHAAKRHEIFCESLGHKPAHVFFLEEGSLDAVLTGKVSNDREKAMEYLSGLFAGDAFDNVEHPFTLMTPSSALPKDKEDLVRALKDFVRFSNAYLVSDRPRFFCFASTLPLAEALQKQFGIDLSAEIFDRYSNGFAAYLDPDASIWADAGRIAEHTCKDSSSIRNILDGNVESKDSRYRLRPVDMKLISFDERDVMSLPELRSLFHSQFNAAGDRALAHSWRFQTRKWDGYCGTRAMELLLYETLRSEQKD
jgi:hypothetical protein